MDYYKFVTPIIFGFFCSFGVFNVAISAECNVRDAQFALKAKGFESGPVDGIWGEATAGAIAAFQSDNRQTISRQLDMDTCKALGLDVNEESGSSTSTSLIGISWSLIPDCKFISERTIKNRLLVKDGTVKSLDEGVEMKMAEGKVRGGIYDVIGVGTYIRFEEPTRICDLTFVSGGFTILKQGIAREKGARIKKEQ